MVVRNLKRKLLDAGLDSSEAAADKVNAGCCGNGMVPRKRTKVGVLISGTGVFLIMFECL